MALARGIENHFNALKMLRFLNNRSFCIKFIGIIMSNAWLLLLWNCEASNLKKNKLYNYSPNNTFQILNINSLSALNKAIEENPKLEIAFNAIPEIKTTIENFIPKEIKGPIVVFFSRELLDEMVISVAFDGEQNRNFKFQVIDKLQYEDRNIEVIDYRGTSYITQLDQAMFYTNSLMTMENVIRNHTAGYSGINSTAFDLQVKSLESDPLVKLIYRSNERHQTLLPSLPLFPEIELDWTQMSLFEENGEIYFQINRVFDHLSINRLHLFKELPKVKLKTKEVCPMDAELHFAIGIPDYRILEANYNTYIRRFNLELLEVDFSSWKNLKEIGFFSHNGNTALALRFSNNNALNSELIPLESQLEPLGNYPLYEVSIPKHQMHFFKNLGFQSELKYMTIVNEYLIYSEDSSFLEKITNHYELEQTLKKQMDLYNLSRTVEKKQSFVWIANTNRLIQHLLENEVIDFKQILELLPTANIPYSKVSADVSEDQIITQTSFPAIDLKTTYSKHLKSSIYHPNLISRAPQWISKFDNEHQIVFQDSMNILNVLDIDGHIKLDILVDASLTSSVFESTNHNNSKSLVFRTKQDIYFVDLESGDLDKRNITSFIPSSTYLIERQYNDQKGKNFYTIDDNIIQKFDQSNNKFTIEGYQLKSSLLEKPSIVKIHDQHYFVFRYASGNVEIVDYNTLDVIPFSEAVSTGSKGIITYQNQFGFIDLSGNLVLFDIQGKKNFHPIQIEPNGCIQSLDEYLVYISGNDLFLNNKIIDMPSGDYSCPIILNTPFGKIVGIMDQENHRYYLFNQKGSRIPGFPVKTLVPLDIIYDQTDQRIKLIGLIDNKTIGLYELTALDIH